MKQVEGRRRRKGEKGKTKAEEEDEGEAAKLRFHLMAEKILRSRENEMEREL